MHVGYKFNHYEVDITYIYKRMRFTWTMPLILYLLVNTY